MSMSERAWGESETVYLYTTLWNPLSPRRRALVGLRSAVTGPDTRGGSLTASHGVPAPAGEPRWWGRGAS